MIRRSRHHFHRWVELPYCNVVASPVAGNALLRLFGDCWLYNALSMARIEPRLRRLLRKMKLQRHTGIVVPSDSDLLIRKFFYEAEVTTFCDCSSSSQALILLWRMLDVVRETYSIRPLDYQSFVKTGRPVTPAHVEGGCSRVVPPPPPPKTSQQVPMLPRAAFQSYFFTESGLSYYHPLVFTSVSSQFVITATSQQHNISSQLEVPQESSRILI